MHSCKRYNFHSASGLVLHTFHNPLFNHDTNRGLFVSQLDSYVAKGTSTDEKKKVSHFQNLITYYGGELIDTLRKKIKNHEHKLADLLQELKGSDKEYLDEHGALMEQLSAFMKTFNSFKSEFFGFIDKKL